MTHADAPKPAVDTEVHGSPEEVWELIATGAGISSWFMPATVEPRPGGAITHRHGSGDDDVSRGRVTHYEPPRRFVYEEEPEPGRTMATEFLVESGAGGTCVVRVVTHGLTADDTRFVDGLVSGWTQALGTLRILRETYAGRPAGSARAWTAPGGTLEEAWRASLRRAGLEGKAAGARVENPAGAGPELAGTVELVHDHGILVRTDAPHAGVLGLIATEFGGSVSVVVDRYVYEEGDPQAAADADLRAWEEHLGGG